MKTIDERARDYGSMYMHPKLYEEAKQLYIKIATEQKEIDDAELARLKKAWEKEAEVNHDTAMAYKQGYHDAIDKACKWLEQNAWKYEFANRYRDDELVDDFRKAME